MLSRLPDELLLQVFHHLDIGEPDEDIGGYRVMTNGRGNELDYFNPGELGPTRTKPPGTRNMNKCLLHLSLIDRRTRAVVLGLLVPEVSVQLRYILSLLQTYLHYPDLAARTTKLEIRLPSRQHVHYSGGRIEEAIINACKTVIWNDRTTSLSDKRAWFIDLRTGSRNAIWAVLFSLLTDLRSLQLQWNELSDYSFLSCLAAPSHAHIRYVPGHWHCQYLAKIFGARCEKLQEFEAPLVWRIHKRERERCTIFMPAKAPIISLHSLQSLRRLVVPERALLDVTSSLPPLEPHSMLPQSLESLTIQGVDGRTTKKTPGRHAMDLLYTLFLAMRECRGIGTVVHAGQRQHVMQMAFPALRYVWLEYHSLRSDNEPQEWFRENRCKQVEVMSLELDIALKLSHKCFEQYHRP